MNEREGLTIFVDISQWFNETEGFTIFVDISQWLDEREGLTICVDLYFSMIQRKRRFNNICWPLFLNGWTKEKV